MEVLATMLGLAAVIFAALALISRRSDNEAQSAAAATRLAASEARVEAEARQAELQGRLDRANEDLEAVRSELADVDQGRADAEAAAAAELEQVTRVASSETDRADAAEALAAERARELDAALGRADELAAELSDTNHRAEAADERVVALASELESARAGQPIHRSVSVGELAGPAPTTLWDLEIARSERTWRHSVALDPSTPSPFPDAADPLKLAVEVEASALREEVGAFVSLDWRAEPVADPVRRLLVLRVANELLASAARLPHPFTMTATGSDVIVIEIRSADDTDRLIDLTLPTVDTGAVTFRSTDDAFVAVLA